MSGLPIVYGCVDCGEAGGLIQEILVRLKDRGLAERGCLAGVGAEHPYHLRRLQGAAAVLVIDGCPIHCARLCVEAHSQCPVLHVDLSTCDFLKPFSRDSRQVQLDRVWREKIQPALTAIQPTAAGVIK